MTNKLTIKRVQKNIQKDIQKNVDKKLNKTAKSVRKQLDARVNKNYRILFRKIFIAGSAAILVIIFLNIFIGKYIEKQVNKRTHEFFENQKVIFDNHMVELNYCMDSIINDYQKYIHKIINEEIQSDSFKLYTTNAINNRFDEIVPGIFNKQIKETTLRLELESKKFLDSLYRPITKLHSVVNNQETE